MTTLTVVYWYSVSFKLEFKLLQLQVRLMKRFEVHCTGQTSGHVETQTMQTADCRLKTVQTMQTECYFFLLVP